MRLRKLSPGESLEVGDRLVARGGLGNYIMWRGRVTRVTVRYAFMQTPSGEVKFHRTINSYKEVSRAPKPLWPNVLIYAYREVPDNVT